MIRPLLLAADRCRTDLPRGQGLRPASQKGWQMPTRSNRYASSIGRTPTTSRSPDQGPPGSSAATDPGGYRSRARLADCLHRGDVVPVARQRYQQLSVAYDADKPADGKAIAEHIVATFVSGTIREIACLGRTLRQWKTTHLGYFTTGAANNGDTEGSTGSSSYTDASPAATATRQPPAPHAPRRSGGLILRPDPL